MRFVQSLMHFLLRALLGLGLVWQAGSHAAPQINWGEMLAQTQGQLTRESLEIDLRQRWESTFVGGVEVDNEIALDPDQVWRWPAERFSSRPDLAARSLVKGERKVARLTVFSESLNTDFNLTVIMPRVDVVHVSYRHDGGTWKTLSAGDRLAMNRWPLVDRQPSFSLPLPPGQIDLVVQFAHRGVLDAPVLLQNNRAFIESRTASIWVTGLFTGINVVMALMGLLMALNFQKSGFLSVSVMCTMMSLVLLFGSGLGGVMLGTDREYFNDQAKFVNNTAWGMMLPWVAAVALGIQSHSRLWWWASTTLAGAGLVLAVIWVNYDWRDSSPSWIAVMLILILMYVLAIIVWAWYKNYSRNMGITLGVLLYTSALFVLFTAYVGILSTDASGIVAAVVCLLASLSLMRGLFLQHRMGRQVIARANISPHRDVLTGLLNREGMQAHVYKTRERLRLQQTCAVFIYVSVLDTEAAMAEHGEQGFEMGLVQIAASLSTSVTGTDGVGRISGHSFGISVLMPPDPAMATRMAQKILSRLMVLASHGAPMASSARMSLAWLPLNGFRIDAIERRCVATLQTLEEGKRIAWVGGLDSYKEASELLHDTTAARGTSNTLLEPIATNELTQNGDALNLYERIHRIEQEMLNGVDTQFLVEEAERLSHVLNSGMPQEEGKRPTQSKPQTAPTDYQPTQQLIKPAAAS